MDDRNSLSAPRPVPGTKLPTWEVDVYRDGVEEPVLTLTIDETTLPPRMRKRKVVWKLPRSAEQMPTFGADEKKRIMDLFKRQKKSRKKLKRGSSTTGALSDGETKSKESQDLFKESGDGSHAGTVAGSAPDVQSSADTAHSVVQVDHGHRVTLSPPPAVEDSEGSDSTRSSTAESLSEEVLKTAGYDSSGHTEDRDGAAPRTAMPPPGFDMRALSLKETQPQAPPEAPRGLFMVPLSSTNIPVDLAKSVVDIYYPFLTQGRSDELALHYIPGAKKSLSVGGAHAVCASLDECVNQLNSLRGAKWEVRGVVAQPGVDNSVVLLVTGAVMLPVNAAFMSFCHTLTLTRLKTGYQIHNDAMALLTDT